MAEGTRMESMEENLRKLQSIVQQHSAAIEQWVSSSKSGLEELHKESNDKMENYHKNTEQRLENLSEKMRNLSRDREQESPLQENGANQGISGPRSTQKAIELPQFPIPDRRMPGSSTNLEHSGNQSKDFHRDFIDRSMSSRGDSVTKVDGDRQILYVSSMEDSCLSKSEDDLSEIDATIDTSIREILPGRFVHVEKQSLMNAHHMFDEMPKGKVEVFQPLKVNSISSLETMAYQIESEEMSEWVVDVVEPIEIGLVDMKFSSTAMEIMLGAHQVFEKMSEKKMADFDDLVDLLSTFGDDFNSIDSPSLFTFDPGGVLAFFNGSKLRSSAIEATIEGAILERIWQWHWDPGGLV